MARRPWDASSIDRVLVPGILAGMVAAIPMGLFAMIAAATFQNRGFYTPMYHITSLLGDRTMERSLQEAARGDAFFLVVEPLLFGVATHLMVGAFWGAVFSLIARALPSRTGIVLAGLVYGLLVMLFMGFILVPAADAILEGGKRVKSVPSAAGWGTLIIQHVIFGLVLGLWLGPEKTAPSPGKAAERRRQ